MRHICMHAPPDLKYAIYVNLPRQRPPLTMYSMSSESDAPSSEPRSSTSDTPPDSYDTAPASDSSSSEPRSDTSPDSYDMAPASDSSPSETRSPTSATPLPNFYEAAHAVLNTNELICEIISYLPLEDVVATTGVCRTWRCALYGSLAIQRALSFAPENIRQIATRTENFLERVEDIRRQDYADVGEVNPFLARICGPVWSTNGDNNLLFTNQIGTMSPWESFEHPDGLWRDMLITQPPTSHIRVCLHPKKNKSRRGFVAWHDETFYGRCDEGIRMGDLYDLIESEAQALQEQVAVRLITTYFIQENKPSDTFHDRYWEVRKGEVVRELLPPSS
jgi:hypothetical protein